MGWIITVDRYTGRESNITIPSKLGGYTVTQIGDYTVKDGVFKDKAFIQSVTIPSSVQYIYQNSFKGCTGLRSVKFNEGLKSIYDNAFYGCTAIQSISFPKSLNRLVQVYFKTARA